MPASYPRESQPTQAVHGIHPPTPSPSVMTTSSLPPPTGSDRSGSRSTGKKRKSEQGNSGRPAKVNQSLILTNNIQSSLSTVVDALRSVGTTPEANVDTAVRMLQETSLDAGNQAILMSLFSTNHLKAGAFCAMSPGPARDSWIDLELELFNRQNHR